MEREGRALKHGGRADGNVRSQKQLRPGTPAAVGPPTLYAERLTLKCETQGLKRLRETKHWNKCKESQRIYPCRLNV